MACCLGGFLVKKSEVFCEYLSGRAVGVMRCCCYCLFLLQLRIFEGQFNICVIVRLSPCVFQSIVLF